MISDLKPALAVGTSRASRLKERVRPHLKALCRHLLPRGYFDGSNWRVGSIHGEPGTSLSVCLAGSWAGCWKDFAEDDDHGDIIALWMGVKRTDFPDTLQEIEDWLKDLPVSAADRCESFAPTDVQPTYTPRQIPAEVERIWQEGLCRLSSDSFLQFAIDQWRGWPRGTTALLCQRRLFACVRLPEREGLHWAFAVEYPISGGLVRIGFHAREILPPQGARARWVYRPNPRAGSG